MHTCFLSHFHLRISIFVLLEPYIKLPIISFEKEKCNWQNAKCKLQYYQTVIIFEDFLTIPFFNNL